MTDNPKQNPSELAGAYALDALSSDEKAEYERHLASSRSAQREADSFADVAAALGFNAEPVGPSAALRASLLAALDSTPQLPRETVPGHRPESTDAPAAPVATEQPGAAPAAPATKASTTRPATGSAQRKAAQRWFSQPMAFAVAAVALVAVLLGVNTVTSAFNGGNGLTEALQLAQINAQPDAQRETIKLTNINDKERVVATLVWSGGLGQSAIIVDGLSALTEEQIYELWYIGEDGPISAGTFNTDGAGGNWRILEGAMAAGDAVGVTVEPAGGSEQPTTDPLIVIHTA